ncbi:MAG: peptidylprolyl isomerase [Chloroherpetonaceae bacterium]|nr:peptidylprolyl isomerase [Chloroherpetonaceae bacterium]
MRVYQQFFRSSLRLFFILFTGWTNAISTNAQPTEKATSKSSPLLEIIRKTDQRDALALQKLLGKNAELDEAIFLGLGSIQADTAYAAIMKGLQHSAKKVRLAAAFALGQSLSDNSYTDGRMKEIIAKFQAERDEDVKSSILIALGKVGREKELEWLSQLRFSKSQIKLVRAQAESFARFAIRGVSSEVAVRVIGGILAAAPVTDTTKLDFAAYALARTPDPLIAPAESLLFVASRFRNPNTRMYAVNALSKIQTQLSLIAIFERTADSDWRVQVNAFRALVPFIKRIDSVGLSTLSNRYSSILKTANYHVKKSILESFQTAKIQSPEIYDAVALLLSDPSVDIQRTTLQTLASLDRDRAISLLKDLMEQKKPSVGAFQGIDVLIKTPQGVPTELVVWAQRNVTHPQKDIGVAALRAFGSAWISNAKTSRYAPLTNDVFQTNMLAWLSEFSNANPQNAGAVQEILSVLSIPEMKNVKYAAPVAKAMTLFKSNDNSETLIEFFKTLELIGGQDEIPKLAQYLNDENPQVRRKAGEAYQKITGALAEIQLKPYPEPSIKLSEVFLKSKPVIVLKTTRGEIEAELFPKVAPYTVASILNLVEERFFDGLLFHRVVSNFVVQGGDPKGDGTGGPPYTIRSEFSPLSYERGTLGMASAGKDTEGSQFFFMHSPQPHLDGRYSIFGKIVKGLPVLDLIEQGDRIVSIRVKKNK